MSFKKAFTKLGLVEEVVVPVKKPSIVVKTPTVAIVAPLPTSTIDPVISGMLEQFLQDNKLSGFDYLKFISATEEMKTYNAQEEPRFQMAFLAAKQVGVDKDSLIKSGQHYLDVLQQAEDDFKTGCSQFEKNEIQAREIRINELDTKLTTLAKQLDKAKLEHDSLITELEQQKSELSSRQTTFQTTFQSFTSGIQNNIAKITKYLS